jgi:hypothetical protein
MRAWCVGTPAATSLVCEASTVSTPYSPLKRGATSSLAQGVKVACIMTRFHQGRAHWTGSFDANANPHE